MHTDEVRSALYNAQLLAGNEAAREAEVDDLHSAVRPVLQHHVLWLHNQLREPILRIQI